MTTEYVELAIYKFFMENGKYQAIIPRVHKKFKIHECDLIVITNSDYIYEIEIKVSVSDCKADLNKEHKHKDLYSRLKYQWFAIPYDILDKCLPLIPDNFGIIVVNDISDVYVFREAQLNKKHRKITKGELINLLTTGCKRYFSILEKNLKGGEQCY